MLVQNTQWEQGGKYYQKTTNGGGSLAFRGPPHCTVNHTICRDASLDGSMNVTLFSNTFTNGRSLAKGGAVFALGRFIVKVLSCSFQGTEAGLGGGAVFSKGSTLLEIISSNFTECRAVQFSDAPKLHSIEAVL